MCSPLAWSRASIVSGTTTSASSKVIEGRQQQQEEKGDRRLDIHTCIRTDRQGRRRNRPLARRRRERAKKIKGGSGYSLFPTTKTSFFCLSRQLAWEQQTRTTYATDGGINTTSSSSSSWAYLGKKNSLRMFRENGIRVWVAAEAALDSILPSR